MCDDRTGGPAPGPPRVTRRGLLRGTAGLAGGLLLAGPRSLLDPASASVLGASAASPVNAGGLFASRHAMHVHTSYSEGSASLQAQVAEALANGFDTMWTTDHDNRMSAYRAPDAFHFPALTETVQEGAYTWRPGAKGSLSTHRGAVTAAPSPLDGAAGARSLTVRATSSGAAEASYRYVLDGSAANLRHRTNLTGVRLRLEVLPQLPGTDAWGRVEVETSYRPATGGRPAGTYRLLYELGTAPAGASATGLVGKVRVRVVAGRWNSVVLDPVADLARLWPDLVAGDAGLVQLSLGAVSRRRAAAVVSYSWLRFEHTLSAGDAPLLTQRALIDAYALRYPGLAVRQGVEVSGTEHSNWFGGDPHLIDYPTDPTVDALQQSTATGHAYGCLVSLNHPFGSGGGAALTQAAQDAARQRVAADLLARSVAGVDLVEAGYRRRGGMSLETHLALVDTLWRSGCWVTATGVNDDHEGLRGTWATQLNHFYTSVWQTSPATLDALAALRRGAAFVGELGSFPGFLDLSADGVPMGAASVQPGRLLAELTVMGVDLPTGAVVEVVRGPVDYSGAVDPGTEVVAELPAAAFATGSATVAVAAASSCFVRAQVRASDGRRVAFTNPVFLLQEEPPADRALPLERRSLAA